MRNQNTIRVARPAGRVAPATRSLTPAEASQFGIRTSATVLLLAVAAFLSINARAYDEAPVENGGSISGTVYFDGAPPERKPLDIQAPCHQAVLNEEIIAKAKNDKSVLANVVVSIVEIDKGKAFSKDMPVLDQKGCVFAPHIVVVPAGGTLKVLNTDDSMHNIHVMADLNKEINKAMEPEGQTTVKFEEPERIALCCNMHRWMKSWIIVAANPYFDVTNSDGKFKIKDVPPGKYTLSFWHEKLGEQKKEIKVKEGDEAKVECTFAPEIKQPEKK
jgi:plastocyanin